MTPQDTKALHVSAYFSSFTSVVDIQIDSGDVIPWKDHVCNHHITGRADQILIKRPLYEQILYWDNSRSVFSLSNSQGGCVLTERTSVHLSALSVTWTSVSSQGRVYFLLSCLSLPCTHRVCTKLQKANKNKKLWTECKSIPILVNNY